MPVDPYIAGWNDHIQYLQEQQAAGSAGSLLSTLGAGCLLIGGICVSMIADGIYQYGWSGLHHPFAERELGVGLFLLALIYPLWTEAGRRQRIAQQKFNDKWHAKANS